MYLKPHVCSAFVLSDSRSDSSALLDKVGLTAAWSVKRDAPSPSFLTLLFNGAVARRLRDICRLLTRVTPPDTQDTFYILICCGLESGPLLLIQTCVVCCEWGLIGTKPWHLCLCARWENGKRAAVRICFHVLHCWKQIERVCPGNVPDDRIQI